MSLTNLNVDYFDSSQYYSVTWGRNKAGEAVIESLGELSPEESLEIECNFGDDSSSNNPSKIVNMPDGILKVNSAQKLLP